MMLFASVFSDFVVRTVRWLCVEECRTAAVLLSMSFGINSLFTGLAFSRFNVFVWMKRQALACVQRGSDAKFLEKIERLAETDAVVRIQLDAYRARAARFRVAMTEGSAWWEWMRRSVSMFGAMAAFVLVAFECTTRMGFCLILPYLFLLVLHLFWLFAISWRVHRAFTQLAKAVKGPKGKRTR